MTETKTVLTGTQKVAVVLMHMGQQRAAQVMQQFSEAEAEQIAAEIVRLRRVDATVAAEIFSEFYDMTMMGRWQPRGGRDYAAGLLEASFGSEKAAGVMDRLASSMAGRAFEFLDAAEPGQVVSLLDGELPQTIALVLAHLRPEHASSVISGLDARLRTDVARCIATMGTATPEAVTIVTDILKTRAVALVGSRDPIEVVGGIQPLVDIINRSDVSTERALLEGLAELDPELAEEVRSRMLTFADIIKLEARDVQQVIRGIDPAVLAVAMKGSSESLVAVIRENLSERNQEFLDEEIRTIGRVRVSQVEEARAEIVRSIRDLEAKGTITVQRADEEEYVS